MKFLTITAALATAPFLANAALTYNIMQALAPGEFEKYHCLSTASWNERLPACLQECQIQANREDGCAYDDFACHCVNYNTFSELIEPCAFPPALGGHGTCTFAELGRVRPMVSDLCNFFNATLYAGYAGCPQKLSPLKTLLQVAEEPVVVTH